MTLSVIRPSRASIRTKIKSLVDAEMVGDGKPLVACYKYQKGKLKGVSPCMVLVSEPVQPNLDGTINEPYSLMKVGAHVFVRYEDVGTGTVDVPEWTEEESEEAIDTINQQFLSLMAPYIDRTGEKDPEWEYMRINVTEIDAYKDLEGLEFRHEYYPMIFQVPNIL